MPFLLQLFLFTVVFLLIYISVVTLLKKYQTHRYLKALKNVPFPDAYELIIKKIPYYDLLNEADRKSIHFLIMRFLYLKTFKGRFIDLTDEMRVSIAFYACFMTLRLPNESYPSLETIIIYPYSMLTDPNTSLVAHGEKSSLLQGLSSGRDMIIAWNSAKREIFHIRHSNVLIHEFAHGLDFESGAFNGIPPLESAKYYSFSKVMYRRFQTLQEKVHKERFMGKYKFLGSYAATNEAEFFAVMSELYFERPVHLKKNFLDIYNALDTFYQMHMERLLSHSTSRHHA